MVKFLSNLQFFRTREVSAKVLFELVPLFQVQSAEAGEEVVRYGEKGDKFFIILQGSVEVFIPNPTIKSWRLQRADFLREVNWKRSLDNLFYKALIASSSEIQDKQQKSQALCQPKCSSDSQLPDKMVE